MVKYIFLDFDGVLNTEQYRARLAIDGSPTKDEYGPLFDPKAVARLAKIIEETKAEIFVISSWGEVLREERVIEMWEKRGLPGEIRAVFIPNKECDSKAKWIERCIDKQIFLPYVILDDEYQFSTEQEKYLIIVNPVTGINKEDTEISIDILNRLDNLPLNGGHDVPIPKIISGYDKSIANCIALAPYVDRLYVYDNSIEDTEARLLFRLSEGELAKRYEDDLPSWASNILPK